MHFPIRYQKAEKSLPEILSMLNMQNSQSVLIGETPALRSSRD